VPLEIVPVSPQIDLPFLPFVFDISMGVRREDEALQQELDEILERSSGCHFAGGGGIGPPLMDDDWIYGGEPAQIFDSIASGRANGMPAYGDMLAAEQVWHIVAYVETLSQIERREERGQPGDPRRHER
jgi:hypothetical protein